MQAYRLADEPRPSTLSHATVDPVWPLFAMMFGGSWLAWPWYIFNGFAMGSPTLRREIGIAILGLIGSCLLVGLVVVLDGQGILTKSNMPYVLLALLVWKLGVSYWLYMTQARTFEIYQYYGGIARNGLIIIFVSLFIRSGFLKSVQESLGTLAVLVVQ